MTKDEQDMDRISSLMMKYHDRCRSQATRIEALSDALREALDCIPAHAEVWKRLSKVLDGENRRERCKLKRT